MVTRFLLHFSLKLRKITIDRQGIKSRRLHPITETSKVFIDSHLTIHVLSVLESLCQFSLCHAFFVCIYTLLVVWSGAFKPSVMDHFSYWWLCLGPGINGLSLAQPSSHSEWIIISHCHRMPCTALYCDSLSNFRQQSCKLSVSPCIITVDCKGIYENKIWRNNAPLLSSVAYTKFLIVLVEKKKEAKRKSLLFVTESFYNSEFSSNSRCHVNE